MANASTNVQAAQMQREKGKVEPSMGGYPLQNYLSNSKEGVSATNTVLKTDHLEVFLISSSFSSK